MTKQIFRNIATAGFLGLVGLLNGCSAIKPQKVLEDPFLRAPVAGASFDNPASVNTYTDAPTTAYTDAPPTTAFTNALAESLRNDSCEAEKCKLEVGERSDGAYLTGRASGSFATKFLKDYRVLGKGPVTQADAVLERKDNLLVGDSIGVGAFGNYDVHSGELVEADFTTEAKVPVPVGKLFGGYDNPNYGDFIGVGYQYRHYQNGLLGLKGKDFGNHVGGASYLHSSKLDLELEGLGLIPDANTSEGYLFRFIGSKKWELGKVGDRDLCVRPFASTGYGIKWYGINGWTAVNSGVDVTFEKKHSIFGGKIECQSSLNDKVDNVLYAGAEVGLRF